LFTSLLGLWYFIETHNWIFLFYTAVGALMALILLKDITHRAYVLSVDDKEIIIKKFLSGEKLSISWREIESMRTSFWSGFPDIIISYHNSWSSIGMFSKGYLTLKRYMKHKRNTSPD
jgi:hypothetical protein